MNDEPKPIKLTIMNGAAKRLEVIRERTERAWEIVRRLQRAGVDPSIQAEIDELFSIAEANSHDERDSELIAQMSNWRILRNLDEGYLAEVLEAADEEKLRLAVAKLSKVGKKKLKKVMRGIRVV